VVALVVIALTLLAKDAQPAAQVPSLVPVKAVRGDLEVALRGAPQEGDIAGLYIVYRRPKAFLSVAQSFRDVYPSANFFIACDAGCFDYRRVVAGLHATWAGPFRLTIKNGRMFLATEECLALFDVWRGALARISEPFFMILEDDVKVIQRVKSKLCCDLNGAVTFAGMEPLVEQWILKRNPKPNSINNGGFLYLAGMGGNLVRTEYWRPKLASPELPATVASLITETGVAAIDGILSALVYAWNGTVGFYDGYGFGWSPEMGVKLAAGGIEVEHDAKSTYTLNLTKEDLEALGPGWEKPLNLPGLPGTV
jgi:hypothetical protein